MSNNDDYYSFYEHKETNFKGFEVTSINPDYHLLVALTCVAVFYVLMNLIVFKCRKKKTASDLDRLYLHRIHSRYNNPNTEINGIGMEVLDTKYSDIDILSLFAYNEITYIERKYVDVNKSRPNETDLKIDDGTYVVEVRQNQDFGEWTDVKNSDCCSDVPLGSRTSDAYFNGETVYEIKNMINLARPWAFGSFVENVASIIEIAVISSNIGTAEMICYSYVWFVIDSCHIISTAMYNSLYKHANNAVSLETEEAYLQVGKNIQICCIVNAALSSLISICLVLSMGSILRLFGYGDAIVQSSNSYTIIAVISNILNTSNSYVTIVPDLDGRADFDALYGLFESAADIAVSMFIVSSLKPTLAQLGLIHLAQDMISYIIYYSITVGWKGYFDNYKAGILYKLDLLGDDRSMLESFLKKTVPLTFDEICDELEWFVLTLFSTHLGVAEAASWILINHIWGFVGVLNENVASALEYRCAHLLSNGKIQIAQKLTFVSIWIAFSLSAISCASLFILKNVIVNGITGDETLRGMLFDIIPFIVLFDPIVSISTTAEYLNRALALYERATAVETLMTILVTIPAAYISTYIFNYNIEGLVAASYIGSFSIGFFSNVLFMSADWKRAVEKNIEMTGLDTESKDKYDIESGFIQEISL